MKTINLKSQWSFKDVCEAHQHPVSRTRTPESKLKIILILLPSRRHKSYETNLQTNDSIVERTVYGHNHPPPNQKHSETVGIGFKNPTRIILKLNHRNISSHENPYATPLVALVTVKRLSIRRPYTTLSKR
jgi:hypothetical protein